MLVWSVEINWDVLRRFGLGFLILRFFEIVIRCERREGEKEEDVWFFLGMGNVFGMRINKIFF